MSNTMSGKEGRKESEGISGGRNGPCGRQSPGCQGLRNAGKGFLFHIVTLGQVQQQKKFYCFFF